MTTPAAVLEITGLSKSYAALRPLRVESLAVALRERVALGGLDAAGAELFVNLVTGAALPEEGEVRVFGQPTWQSPRDDWLASLDAGIVSHRGAARGCSRRTWRCRSA